MIRDRSLLTSRALDFRASRRLLTFAGLSSNPDCPPQTPNRAFGPKWKKMAEKWILAPKGEKGGKNGRQMGQKWPFSHFSAIFSPFFPGGAKIHCFFDFGPDLGSVQGNRDRKARPTIFA